MPNYDFICFECDDRFSRVVPYEARGLQRCDCGASAEMQFPVESVRGINILEGGYCEPLGCDVTSERDMIQKAKRLGFVPAGDKMRGGRNEHDNSNGLLRARGVSIDDKIRERDRRSEMKENWQSFAQTGNTETPVKEKNSLKKAVTVRHLTANR